MESVDVMHRRKIDTIGLQETKWRGEKAKLDEECKLLYSNVDGIRNVVGKVLGRDLKDKIVNVKRVEGRILSIKIV